VSTSTLTRLAPTQVELEIPITSEEMAAAEERAFRRLSKNVKLPGFRAGKVPRKVFEQTYGAATIASEALDEVVPEVYARAVREHELSPVDRPKMELLPAEEGRPSRLKATVEVRPAIELGDYRHIQVEREPAPITDEDVDRSVQALARERATLVPVDRPAALGDVVTVDYEGTIDGVPFDGGSAKGQMTELDESRFIPGFASGIAGMSAGETKDVEAAFPADYPVADLAGKTPVFHVTVHDVKALEMPAIDDAFAQSISENQSLEDLRGDVRKRLEAISEARVRRAAGRQIMDKLVSAHDFPLPEVLVEREIESTVNDIAGQAAQDGSTFEDYLAQKGKTAESLREELRPEAEQRVKGTLLIEAIARAESINATPADVGEELAALARQYGQPVDRIRKALGNNVISLMDGIVRNKTLEFLVDNAELVDKS
jgi:trigger factor